MRTDWTVLSLKDSAEYQFIKRHYGTRCAARSGVPYMNHIDEGLKVLKAIDATRLAALAYCLHGALQSDQDYTGGILTTLSTSVLNNAALATAMEYRHVANSYLSMHPCPAGINFGPIPEVRQMLVADKI